MPETWDALFYTDSSLLNSVLGPTLPANMHLKMADPGDQADATSHNLLAPLKEDSGTIEYRRSVGCSVHVSCNVEA